MAAQTTVTAKILADVSDFSKGMKRAGASLQKFSSAATKAGRDITTSISAPLILLGREALKVASSFDLAQRKIQGIRGADAPIKKLVSTARELGASTIFTAEEVSNLQLSLAKLGKSDNEILALQGSILKLAQAMDMDLAEAGELVVKNQNRFRDSLKAVGTDLEQASFITNVFTKATQSSLLTSESLATALNYSGSEAAAYGLTLTDTAAILGLLADNGFEASRGGTTFRRILGQLAKDGLSAEQAIAALFSSTKGYAAELEQFGLRGAGGRKVLADLLPQFQELKEALENSEGTVDKFAAAMDESLFAVFKRLISALSDFAIELEELFGKQLKDFINGVTDFVRGLSEMDSQVKRNIAITLAFFAALGPLLLIIGGLTSAAGFFVSAIAGLGFKVLRVRVFFRQLAMELGFVASSFGAQTSAAIASKVATNAAGVAAVKTTTRFKLFSKALRASAIIFALEGILALIDKINRALNVDEEMAVASAKDATLQLEVKAEVKALDDLDMTEIEKRVREGAAKLTLDFRDGITPVPVDKIAERLVPIGVAEAIQKRADEIINSGVNLFGGDPFTIAINQYFAALAKKKKEEEIQKKIDEGSISNISKLVDEYSDLKNQLIDLKKAGLRGEDVDFNALDELESKYEEIGKKLKALGVSGAEAADDLLRIPESLDRLDSAGKKVSDTIEILTDEERTKRMDAAFAGMIDPMRGLKTGANEAHEAIQEIVDQLEEGELLANIQEVEGVVFSIGDLFSKAFETALKGTESLGKAIKTTLIDAIKSLIAKLAGLAVAWGLVALLATIATGGSNLQMAAQNIKSAGFGNFVLQGMGIGSFNTKSGGENNLRVEGVLSGSDVVLGSRRGATALDRIYG